MLRLENVDKTYAGGRVKAVDNLTLQVDDGKVFGFIGPNGAGKTTTIKLLTGILRPDAGRVLINSYDMESQPLDAKRQIGYVPDSLEMYDRLTGMEYLRFLADLYQVGAAERKAHFDEYVAMYGMEDAIYQQIRSYSKGMRQKLSIIGALVHHPSVWILDEPMAGLDPLSVHKLKEDMKRYCAGGCTVFFSTHVLDVAERLCDEIGIIQQGKLIAHGELDEMMRDDKVTTLEDLFLNLTGKEEA